jgi:hypothetical protein
VKKVVIVAVVVSAIAALVLVVYFTGGKSPSGNQPASDRQSATTGQPAPQPAQAPPPVSTAPTSSASGSANPPHTRLALSNGVVSIDASPLDDGQTRFYTVQLPTPPDPVNFFVVKDGAGIYRAAADACDVCYTQKKGFHQEGTEMVCNNCGNRYPLELIATRKGGCNPGPINPNLQVAGGAITISQAELEQVARLF